MAGTRFNQAITIGAAVTVLASLAANVMLYVNGQIQVVREVNYIQTGVSTGAVLQVAGITQKQIIPTTCTVGGTASGSRTNYDFCIVRSPITTTGSINSIGLECGGVPAPFSMSGGFVKSRLTSLTSSFRNFTSVVSVGTGASVTFGTGNLKWNPADFVKLSAVNATWNTANNCQLYIEMRDKYGS